MLEASLTLKEQIKEKKQLVVFTWQNKYFENIKLGGGGVLTVRLKF